MYLGCGEYDKVSIKTAEQFVLNCLSLVKEPSLPWIAFQANPLAELVNTSDDFNTPYYA